MISRRAFLAAIPAAIGAVALPAPPPMREVVVSWAFPRQAFTPMSLEKFTASEIGKWEGFRWVESDYYERHDARIAQRRAFVATLKPEERAWARTMRHRLRKIA